LDYWTPQGGLVRRARALEQARSLGKRYIYFWVDGIHVQARLEDTAQCLLIIIGATPEGRKELVGLTDGVHESAQSWRELLLDLKRRGLSIGPELAIAMVRSDLASGRTGMASDARPALLGAQNRQRPQQTAEEPATESQAGAAGNLDGRDKEGCACGLRRLRRDLGRQIRQGGRVPDQGSRRAARLLRLPGRALEASAHNERHRKLVRHGAPPHRAIQRMSLKQDRARHDLQARRGCRKKLAAPQWPQPVAENYPRDKVHRRNRSCQIASSNRCHLIPSVTKIRR